MYKIKTIEAKEILDSRQRPTVETTVTLAGGIAGTASVPAGASTGTHEAKALPAETAISNVNSELNQALTGQEFDQASLDEKMIELDGTENKGRLGANAILSVSLAFARASAQAGNQSLYLYLQSLGPFGHAVSKSDLDTPCPSLPKPMFNILNGGRHADSVDWQEFMVVPVGAGNFTEGFEWVKKVYTELQKILETRNLSTTIGDEGGFAPKLSRNVEALDLLIEAITQAGFKPSQDIALALDVAASEFKQADKYVLTKEGGRELTAEEMITWYEDLIAKYPIISIEDGLAQDDWTDWQTLTTSLGQKVNLVGDDLFVTNAGRLEKGIEAKVANAVLVKPNQIGTLTETLNVIAMAKTADYKIIISHRSGETLDSFIADLAVGASADFIKAGAPARPERLAKYERLLEIEKELS